MSRAANRIGVPSLLVCAAFGTTGCLGGEEAAPPIRIDPEAATCAPDPVLEIPRVAGERLGRAKRGVHRVYGFRTTLEPPIDWAMNPHGSLRFQAYLSNWEFMDRLLAGYRQRGDPRFLEEAVDLALDWVRANPRENPAGGVGTWSGKIAGDRAPRLAYLLRAARCAGVLDSAGAAALRESLGEHIQILLGPESAGDTNHALYVQVGLAAVARQIPGMRGASRILDVAERRFQRVLEGRLANGVWLEHSTSYQFLAIRVVERFLDLIGRRADELDADLEAMKDAAAWLTAPDGRHTLLGDSRMLEAPADIQRLATKLEGLRVFPEAGLAAIRQGESHLVVTAGFHNTTHKHADELSFELSEGGRRIVADTGMYHKDPGEIRDFVVSARAHSALTVDDQDFQVTDPANAYGSGLVAWGSGAGWHAVLAANPLLADQDASHYRLFLYRPGVALVVGDHVRTSGVHTFTRRLQLGPAIAATPESSALLGLRSPRFDGALFDTGRPSEPVLVRGAEDPLGGYMSPDYREWRPRTTVELTDRGGDLVRAQTLALDERRVHAAGLEWDSQSIQVRLASGTAAPFGLTIEREGSDLRIVQGG